MIRTLTVVFASVATGAGLTLAVIYLALHRIEDTTVPMPTPVSCAVGWGDSRP